MKSYFARVARRLRSWMATLLGRQAPDSVQASDADDVTAHATQETEDEVVRYWTDERMAEASPLPMGRDDECEPDEDDESRGPRPGDGVTSES